MIRVLEVCLWPMWLTSTSIWATFVAVHFIQRPWDFL